MIDNDTGQLQPGAQGHISFELTKPIGLEPGIRFAIREDGKTVGAGVVIEVFN